MQLWVGVRCMGWQGAEKEYMFYWNGGNSMATTGELRAIIEELELVDIGDAANYLGEEATVEDESLLADQTTLLFLDMTDHSASCDCNACQAQNN